MDKNYLREIKEIEKKYLIIINKIKINYPRCINYQTEKEKFFKAFSNGETYNPEFKYKLSDIDQNIIQKLKKFNLEISDKNDKYGFKKLYKEKLKKKLLKIKLYNSWGKSESTEYAKKYYGVPKEEVLNFAEKFSKEYSKNKIKKKNHKKIFSPEDLGKIIKAEVLKLFGRKIQIIYSSGYSSIGVLNLKAIRISPTAKFSLKDLKRLVVHEIHVHYARRINGLNTGFKILSSGTGNYLETEEGLAVFLEYFNNLLDKEKMFIYSGRALAAKYVLSHSFYETFIYLKGLGFNNNDAFRICFRTKRNLINTSQKGGFTKDHIYLSGFLKIKKRYSCRKEDIIKLFIGKIDLKNLTTLKTFINEYFKSEDKKNFFCPICETEPIIEKYINRTKKGI